MRSHRLSAKGTWKGSDFRTEAILALFPLPMWEGSCGYSLQRRQRSPHVQQHRDRKLDFQERGAGAEFELHQMGKMCAQTVGKAKMVMKRKVGVDALVE